MKFLLFEEFSF